jgi:hypothetical protein
MKEFQMKSLKAYISLGAMTALALTAFVTGPAFGSRTRWLRIMFRDP